MTIFPAAIAALPPAEPLTEDDFLALFHRILPSHYIDPLLDPGPGYELLEAYAAVGRRISEAVAHVENGLFIATATGGSYSEGQVEFYRTSTVFGGVILKAGSVVSTADGYRFQTLADVTFETDDLGPHAVTVRALVRSWLYDKPGEKLAADGSTIPGSIISLTGPVLPDPLVSGYSFDPTIEVRQTTDTVGGSAPMLDGIGADRGLIRTPEEGDADYRVRVGNLPDTVTPAAINKQLQQRMGAALQRFGLSYQFNELWDLRVQTGWDPPVNVVVQVGGPVPYAPVCTEITDFSQNVFVWDYDPSVQLSTSGLAPSGYTNSNRWFESLDYSGSIIVAIPYDEQFWPLYQAVAESLAQTLPAGVHAYFVFQP